MKGWRTGREELSAVTAFRLLFSSSPLRLGSILGQHSQAARRTSRTAPSPSPAHTVFEPTTVHRARGPSSSLLALERHRQAGRLTLQQFEVSEVFVARGEWNMSVEDCKAETGAVVARGEGRAGRCQTLISVFYVQGSYASSCVDARVLLLTVWCTLQSRRYDLVSKHRPQPHEGRRRAHASLLQLAHLLRGVRKCSILVSSNLSRVRDGLARLVSWNAKGNSGGGSRS